MQLLQPSWYLGVIMWVLIVNYLFVFFYAYRLVFKPDNTSLKNRVLLLIVLLLIPLTVFVYFYRAKLKKENRLV